MNSKKMVRQQFRDAVFSRDGYKCVVCGAPAIDAHHITPREMMLNGGYVKENGVSLCGDCHIEAESWLKFRNTELNSWRLYELIGSDYEKANKDLDSTG